MKQGIQGRQSPPILQSLSEQSMSPFVLFPLIRRSAHSERLLVHSPLHASWDDSLGVLGADVEHTQHLCFLLLNCSNGKNQPWRLTFAKQMTKRRESFKWFENKHCDIWMAASGVNLQHAPSRSPSRPKSLKETFHVRYTMANKAGDSG